MSLGTPTADPTIDPTKMPTTSNPTTSAPSSPPTPVLTSENYILIQESRSWSDAEDYCLQNYDTSLASMHSNEENEEARDLCALSSTHCLIGLNVTRINRP